MRFVADDLRFLRRGIESRLSWTHVLPLRVVDEAWGVTLELSVRKEDTEVARVFAELKQDIRAGDWVLHTVVLPVGLQGLRPEHRWGHKTLVPPWLIEKGAKVERMAASHVEMCVTLLLAWKTILEAPLNELLLLCIGGWDDSLKARFRKPELEELCRQLAVKRLELENN